MVFNDGFPAVSGVVSAAELRGNLAALVATDIYGNVRPGLLPGDATSNIWTTKPSMSIDFATFNAILDRSGPVFIRNQGVANIGGFTAPVANKKIIVVYMKQNDQTPPLADGSSVASLGFVETAASATPNVNDALALLPVGAHPLVSIEMPSTATTTQSSGVIVKRLHQWTNIGMSPFWVGTSADLTDAGKPRYPTGQQAIAMDTGITWISIEGGWKRWSAPWTNFTPVQSGIANAGSGAKYDYARWKISEGMVRVQFKYTLGAGASGNPPQDPNFTLPPNLPLASWFAQGDATIMGMGTFSDFSGGAGARYVIAATLSISGARIIPMSGANMLTHAQGAYTALGANDSFALGYEYPVD